MTIAASQPAHLRDVPFMGVIFVLDEATKVGFALGDPDWINLGQGQPEVGPLPDAPERIARVDLEPSDHAYGPVSGTRELREAVAAYYNDTFRRGRAGRYTADHVAIVQGGRLALSRALAALGETNVGYMLPDYSAYEDMLSLHLSRVTPVPVRTRPEDGFRLGAADLGGLVERSGVGAFLLSNPCNPTGAVISGERLDDLVRYAGASGCALLVDEFYSHYHYVPGQAGQWLPAEGPVSAAAHVTDPDTDDVLIFDGLTKNFRYPGWRLGWVLGPPGTIAVIDRVGSGMDGGPSRLVQRAALAALEPGYARQETAAVRAEFARKRNHAVAALRDMGVVVDAEPAGTFYVWGCLDGLPAPLNDGMEFFRRALEFKVITVPGQLFDVNPGRRRRGASPYTSWMRFSFGPGYDALTEGLDRLRQMVAKHA
ncbi:pyridoxal phosphate-dependent aminotransferase [Phytohabitans kaempferiae]|uniref:Pyridoxal phosphate-dependent aminotransferase n=1 Tax=Phytohabitans kaempferiae TaxID=1620943 RepID=A0ABV6M6G3_9ACTN